MSHVYNNAKLKIVYNVTEKQISTHMRDIFLCDFCCAGNNKQNVLTTDNTDSKQTLNTAKIPKKECQMM